MNKKVKNLDIYNLLFMILLFLPLIAILLSVVCQAVSVGQNTNTIDIESMLNNYFAFCESCNIFGLNSINEWLFDNIISIKSGSNLMLSNCLGFVIWYFGYAVLVYFVNIIFKLFRLIPESIEKMFRK